LFRAGDTPVCVWYVRRGLVLLSSMNRDGSEAQVGLRGPGALIGLEALDGAPATYQAWALSDVGLCRLDSVTFRAWVGDPEAPAAVVARLALDELARCRQERNAISGKATARVARFLVERARAEGSEQPLPVQQQLLARMLRMSPETLSRTLARLRAVGALAPGRGVAIADLRALERAADSDE
jgi:CRP-like cAMP-binding protein